MPPFSAGCGGCGLRRAPLERYARDAARLAGVYLPYWTYDARTRSSYTGERGDAYYVQVPCTTTVNGRRVTRMRNERRIRWTPGARQRQPFLRRRAGRRQRVAAAPDHATRLAPWDLDALVPYDERYLSGFRSEVYQVGLDQGFQRALQIMAAAIRDDVHARHRRRRAAHPRRADQLLGADLQARAAADLVSGLSLSRA